VTRQTLGEHLVIQPNTLVLYNDEAGDERLHNQQYPIFAFGGVACVTEFHLPISLAWQAMKAATFPQVVGPLHAKTHFRDRLAEPKRLAVLARMDHQQLGRFGTVITSSTVVSPDRVMRRLATRWQTDLPQWQKGWSSLAYGRHRAA